MSGWSVFGAAEHTVARMTGMQLRRIRDRGTEVGAQILEVGGRPRRDRARERRRSERRDGARRRTRRARSSLSSKAAKRAVERRSRRATRPGRSRRAGRSASPDHRRYRPPRERAWQHRRYRCGDGSGGLTLADANRPDGRHSGTANGRSSRDPVAIRACVGKGPSASRTAHPGPPGTLRHRSRFERRSEGFADFVDVVAPSVAVMSASATKLRHLLARTRSESVSRSG